MYIEFISITILFGQSWSFSYPVFGTKRYHRTGNVKHLVNPVQQYYDDPYIASYPEYQDNGYYYLPRRDTQYYGLPTYRGEYKPTPYYYAHGPSYSYFDDREQANPLDDLHEEMLQEDQRERQRDIPSYGQEDAWFEKPIRQDRLTNAFLKNLVLYNKQMSRQQPQYENGGQEFDDYNDGSEYYEPINLQQSPIDDYDMQNYDNDRQPSSATDNSDDKDVRELKLLANKHSNFRHPTLHDEFPNNHPLTKTHDIKQFVNNHKLDEYSNNRQLDQYANNHEVGQHESKNHDYMQDSYDADPEYDDEWINWDKKRSSNIERPIKTTTTTFNSRKPSPVLAHFQKTIPTLPPAMKSSSKSDIKSITKQVNIDKSLPGHQGQKEVVLPRPATPVRHPFTEPIMDVLTHNSIQEKRETKTNGSAEKSPSVYGTIKQLLAMEQSLSKELKTPSKLQKRYVSSEGSLVQELDGLKRAAA